MSRPAASRTTMFLVAPKERGSRRSQPQLTVSTTGLSCNDVVPGFLSSLGPCWPSHILTLHSSLVLSLFPPTSPQPLLLPQCRGVGGPGSVLPAKRLHTFTPPPQMSPVRQASPERLNLQQLFATLKVYGFQETCF